MVSAEELAAELRSEGLRLLHSLLVKRLDSLRPDLPLSPRGLTFEQEVELRLAELHLARANLLAQRTVIQRQLYAVEKEIGDWDKTLKLYQEFQSQTGGQDG